MPSRHGLTGPPARLPANVVASSWFGALGPLAAARRSGLSKCDLADPSAGKLDLGCRAGLSQNGFGSLHLAQSPAAPGGPKSAARTLQVLGQHCHPLLSSGRFHSLELHSARGGAGMDAQGILARSVPRAAHMSLLAVTASVPRPLRQLTCGACGKIEAAFTIQKGVSGPQKFGMAGFEVFLVTSGAVIRSFTQGFPRTEERVVVRPPGSSHCPHSQSW
ncbi:hypothetical protein AXG93_138s1190 [Marchantia polymorpha subsp. ruderalis]|uniref:Uncharacterized protein n=1 Tax=Marchantia polymorpha subsp. ruderalis TaxID=1480154 RepID=A0A176VLK8_MARPO|nr:hypothetical protein AXG93_138s1190 [Marchantia polymorpha subsp. ruderalis]